MIKLNIKCRYIHSDVDTLDRVEILRDLRAGLYDVLIGVNLLREGLDLPEVALVCILDADKAGFLRSATSLIQQMGRAARNLNAQVVMYADKITPAMQDAIDETTRRREMQIKFIGNDRYFPLYILATYKLGKCVLTAWPSLNLKLHPSSLRMTSKCLQTHLDMWQNGFHLHHSQKLHEY